MFGTGPLMSLVPVSYQRNHRGFTGHEHLDEWGLVNMNGRIYNPDLGRFLSADPYVQFPQSTQGLDRYAYVQNNPLSATDPSGHGIMGILGSILSLFPLTQPIGATLIAVDGYLQGGLRGLVASALSAYASFGVGKFLDHYAFGIGYALGKVGGYALGAGLHGLAQGIVSSATGGRFGSSFLAAAASSAFSPRGEATTGREMIGRVLQSSIVGGTASVIGGGKFANGAQTGAFIQAFNDLGAQVIRASQQRHAAAVEAKKAGLSAQGHKVLNPAPEELVARLPDLPARKYDIVSMDAEGIVWGWEVKSSLFSRLRLNEQQVAFDVAVYTHGGAPVPRLGVTINRVGYLGAPYGGKLNARWSSMRLYDRLIEAGIRPQLMEVDTSNPAADRD